MTRKTIVPIISILIAIGAVIAALTPLKNLSIGTAVADLLFLFVGISIGSEKEPESQGPLT